LLAPTFARLEIWKQGRSDNVCNSQVQRLTFATQRPW
jgi:hypothetical protein